MKPSPSQLVAVAVLVLVSVLGIAMTAFAHHSQAMFDVTKSVTYEGTVTEVRWINPHSFFYMDGKQVGVTGAPVANWALEGPGLRALTAQGFTKESIKVGDKITISGCPRKDTVKQILLLNIKLPDGKEFSTKPPDFLLPPQQ